MARSWPSRAGSAQASAKLAGEVVLALLLAVTLAYSWRDGVPPDEFVGTVGPAPVGIATLQVSGNNLSGKPVLASRLLQVPPEPPRQLRVPTAAPVQLLIPTLDVHRAVEKVGVDGYGILNLPENSWNAGWYKGGPVPGAPGDAVIEGHAGYPGKPMIFGKLGTLQPGAQIIVVLADGTRQLFVVVSMRSVAASAGTPGLGAPYGAPRLTLITCSGHFDKKSFWYSERLIVETRYAGLA